MSEATPKISKNLAGPLSAEEHSERPLDGRIQALFAVRAASIRRLCRRMTHYANERIVIRRTFGQLTFTNPARIATQQPLLHLRFRRVDRAKDPDMLLFGGQARADNRIDYRIYKTNTRLYMISRNRIETSSCRLYRNPDGSRKRAHSRKEAAGNDRL
jgi:hypothetical protein